MRGDRGILTMFLVVLASPLLEVGLHAQAQQPLPPESQLPTAEIAGQRGAGLPSEAILPDAANPTDNGDALPDESVLPQAEAIAAQDDVLPGQIRPILRLDFEGHTGTIRAIALSDDGKTLVTGGHDKNVHVWQRTDLNPTGWLHRRTIRWPVTRGPRGHVNAVALHGNSIAFAGVGTFGGSGEIRVVDAATGQLTQTLVDQHRLSIASLAWAPGESKRLASIDLEGRLTLWQPDPATGLWPGKVLVVDDEQQYGQAVASVLRSRRIFVPLTFLGNDHLVAAEYFGIAEQNKQQAAWHLTRIDLRSGQQQTLNDIEHIEEIRDLSATPDGRVLASCDWAGSVAIWTFGDAQPQVKSFQPDQRQALFLDLSPDGKRLLLGTEFDVDETGKNPDAVSNDARVQLWDVQATPPKLISERVVAEPVLAGALDSIHQQAIIAQGSRVEVFSFDDQGQFAADAPQQLS
ncbi:MAG: hypothetical protein MI861_26410, partial [Pirellulales bacterium]|nr:hypothetical protein [Pirellulales bacterium]